MWRGFNRYFALLVVKGSLILLYLVGLAFVILVLLKYNRDTTQITNAAFGIAAVLASLCFSCSRALAAEDKDRDRFAYAGERFMHASILVMTASILKYAALTLQSTWFGRAHTTSTGLLVFPLGLAGTALFFHALMSAHTGLKVCGELLWPRMNRYDDYDKLA